MAMPPHQHRAATKPVRRGPLRSTQRPNTAAEAPRTTKNRVYIQPRSATVQSQVLVVRALLSSLRKPAFGQAIDALPPSACDIGSQKTLKP